MGSRDARYGTLAQHQCLATLEAVRALTTTKRVGDVQDITGHDDC